MTPEEHVVTCWENPGRVLLPEVAEAVVVERAGYATCNADIPVGPFGYECSRRPDHASERHIALAGHLVIAAWPGTHEPTLADLEA